MTVGEMKKKLDAYSDNVRVMISVNTDGHVFPYLEVYKVQEAFICDETEIDGTIYETDSEEGYPQTVLLIPDSVVRN